MVHKKSGFNIDPYHGNAAAELMADFFEQSAKDPEHWDAISRGSLERIKAKCAIHQAGVVKFLESPAAVGPAASLALHWSTRICD